LLVAGGWALAVEEQFHLTVPFLIRKIRRSHLTVVLLSIIMGASMLRTVLHLLVHGNFANSDAERRELLIAKQSPPNMRRIRQQPPLDTIPRTFLL
jgi:peptidoglycan/LPS O-acetylase OafA/YrhL